MEQKYYIGLGTYDAEYGWIYKGMNTETANTIDLREEFSLRGFTDSYDKLGVAEITEEEYNSIAEELENDDRDDDLVAKRIEGIMTRLKGEA